MLVFLLPTKLIINSHQESNELLFEKQNKSLEVYKEIMKKSENYLHFHDLFAGAYIDNGELVINVVEVYYNGKLCGSISSIQLSGNTDAAFVKLRNGFWYINDFYPTKKFMNGDYYHMPNASPTYVVQGTTVISYGAVSGSRYGKILLTNVTFVASGITISNAVAADYFATYGDSGAAIVYWRYVGSATAVPNVMV